MLVSLGDNRSSEIAKGLSFKEFKFQHGRKQELKNVCLCGVWSHHKSASHHEFLLEVGGRRWQGCESHGRRAWSLTDSHSPVALPFTHVSARFEAKARGLGKGSKQVLGAQSGIAKMSSKQHLCHIKNLHVGACGRASVRPIHWHSHEEKMQLWHQTSIGWKRMEGKTRHTHS